MKLYWLLFTTSIKCWLSSYFGIIWGRLPVKQSSFGYIQTPPSEWQIGDVESGTWQVTKSGSKETWQSVGSKGGSIWQVH